VSLYREKLDGRSQYQTGKWLRPRWRKWAKNQYNRLRRRLWKQRGEDLGKRHHGWEL
jgi:hypothetical protein